MPARWPLIVMETIAFLLFLTGGISAGIGQFQADQRAGAALPSFTIAQLTTASAKKFPEYIRLVDSVEHPDLACNCFVQRRHDFLVLYEMPRTELNWRAGQLVPLVEIDDLTAGAPANPAGDVEGPLAPSTLLPGWGAPGNIFKWSAPAPVFTLWRMQLDGKVPRSNSGMIVLLLTWPFALFFFVLSLALRFEKP